MKPRLQSRLLGYGLAIVSTIAAVWLRLLISPYLGEEVPFATFFVAVFVTALYAGLGPALLTVLLSGLAAAYFVIPPAGSLLPEDITGWTALALFASLGVGVGLLTERMHRQSQQAKLEWERFSVTLSSIGDAVIVTDMEGRVTFLNPVAQSLTGWSESEAAGKPLEQVFLIVNEQTRQPVENPALRALRDGIIVGLANHTVLISKDGTERPIDDSAAPIRGKSARVMGAVLIFRDVTQRREKEYLLRASEAEFRAAFETAAVGMVQVAPETKHFLRVNDRYCQIVGYSRDELLQISFPELDHPEDRERDVAEFERAMRAEPPVYRLEKRYVRKDGGIVWVDATTSLIRDAEGRPIRTVAVVQDITEEKRTQELLRKQAVLLDLAPVLAHDLDNRIMVWTSGAAAMYGWEKQEAIGRIGHELLRTQFPQPLESIRASLLRFGSWEGELRHIRRDGAPVIVASRWVLHRDEQGEPAAVMEVNADITDRLKMEEALRDADRRKDEFLAMLGHELRNPLAAIKGGVSLLQMPGMDESVQDSAKMVLAQQTDHMVRLVDDLLDVSRILQGKVEIRKQPVMLQRALEEGIEMARPLIESKQCKLEKMFPSEPIRVHADPVRLTQVFGNLLNNAAKYSSKNCRVEVRIEATNGEAVVRIRDWGIGIEPKLLDRVFDLFVQSEQSLARTEGGLGIGLTVVKSLVEMHGGQVEAFSDGSGSGSELVVRLPLEEQKT